MFKIIKRFYDRGIYSAEDVGVFVASGKITAEQAKAGYVGAYPYAEVISGYTAFFLGIRSVVPEVTMTVKYTNTWGDYHLEKECAYRYEFIQV